MSRSRALCQATLKTDPLATPKTDPRRNGVCRSTTTSRGCSPRRRFRSGAPRVRRSAASRERRGRPGRSVQAGPQGPQLPSEPSEPRGGRRVTLFSCHFHPGLRGRLDRRQDVERQGVHVDVFDQLVGGVGFEKPVHVQRAGRVGTRLARESGLNGDVRAQAVWRTGREYAAYAFDAVGHAVAVAEDGDEALQVVGRADGLVAGDGRRTCQGVRLEARAPEGLPRRLTARREGGRDPAFP